MSLESQDWRLLKMIKNEIGFFEGMIAATVGQAIGAISSMQRQEKQSRLMYEDSKRRQDNEIELWRKIYSARNNLDNRANNG